MKFKTKISKIENNDVTIRGEKLSNLVLEGSFANAIFLLLSGRKPVKNEGILFEKVLISIIDHGMGTTSSMATRFVASGGNSMNTAVAGGILSMGDYHGGAIEKAMEQIYNLKQEDIKTKIENKETIYGFGHKIYKDEDPRVTNILQTIKELNYESKFLHFKEEIENIFKEVKGKIIPLNIDGMIAILLCDFKFDSKLGKGIFLIGRTPGLVAQCHEEMTEEKPVRRIDEEEITYEQ